MTIYEIGDNYYNRTLLGPAGAPIGDLMREYNRKAESKSLINFCRWLVSEKGFINPVIEVHSYSDDL